MTEHYKATDDAPLPAAWVDGAALRWLADPDRSPDAHIETTLNVANADGARTALYTAPVVAASDRALLQQALEALELSIPMGSDVTANVELTKAAIRARLDGSTPKAALAPWQALYALENMENHLRAPEAHPYPSGAAEVIRTFVRERAGADQVEIPRG